MIVEVIPYIVALMILYDLSIHVVYLLRKEQAIFSRKLHWWPTWDRWGAKERQNYQYFWVSYWGCAFVLMVAYLLFS